MRLIRTAYIHSNIQGCDTKDDFILNLQQEVQSNVIPYEKLFAQVMDAFMV